MKKLYSKKEDYLVEKQCVGCEKKSAQNHNGLYVEIIDWVSGQNIKFVDLVLTK